METGSEQSIQTKSLENQSGDIHARSVLLFPICIFSDSLFLTPSHSTPSFTHTSLTGSKENILLLLLLLLTFGLCSCVCFISEAIFRSVSSGRPVVSLQHPVDRQLTLTEWGPTRDSLLISFFLALLALAASQFGLCCTKFSHSYSQ